MNNYLEQIKNDLSDAIAAVLDAHNVLLQYAGNDVQFVSYYDGYISGLLKAQSIIDNYGDLYHYDTGCDDICISELIDSTLGSDGLEF